MAKRSYTLLEYLIALENKVKELKKYIDTYNGIELGEINNQISAIQQQITDLRNQINNSNSSNEQITNLKNKVYDLEIQIDEILNNGTSIEVVERVTKEEIDRQIADGTIANLTIANGSITPEKTSFIYGTISITKLNRALLSSDTKFYYKQTTQEGYTDYNVFLFDVSNVSELQKLSISGGNVVRIAGVENYTIEEFKNRIENITDTLGVSIGDILLMSNDSSYYAETLDVNKYNFLAIYIGTKADIELTCSNKEFSGRFKEDIKIAFENFEGKITPDICSYFNINETNSGSEGETNIDFTFNRTGDILAVKEETKLFCYKDLQNTNTQSVILNLKKGNTYHFVGQNLTRCRVAVFYNKLSNNLVFGKVDTGSVADEVLLNNDALNSMDLTYSPKIDSCIVLYVSNVGNAQFSVSYSANKTDGFLLTDDIKVSNDNLLNKSISKEKLNFDLEINTENSSNVKIPKLNNILTSSTKNIDLIFEMEKASNDYVTDGSGKILNITSDQFLSLFYDKYVGKHSDGLKVVKTNLGKDESGLYDIYEYDFIPPHYTDTILLSSGMHTYELSAHFGMAHFIEHYMKYDKEGGYLSDGFEYLRKYIRIKLIAIVNPWGWNQNPKTYGNSNGVNINRNFDYPDENGKSVWEKFPVYTPQENEWNVKGSAPFSEAETKILRDWLLNNLDALYWIDCHTGLGLGPWENFIYYNSKSPLVPKIETTLSVLEDRIRTKYNKQNPTKELRIDDETSIRLDWSEYMGVPSFTLEQTPNNTLWGTSLNNESGDITEYAVTLYAYIMGFLNPIGIDAETWIKSLLNL